jgi:hypothetical protein
MWRTLGELFIEFSGFRSRARARTGVKISAFRQPDAGCRLDEADHAAPLKRFLDAPEVLAECWRPVMFSLPEPNGSFIDLQLVGETLLRQPRKNTTCAKLAAGDKIRDHGSLRPVPSSHARACHAVGHRGHDFARSPSISNLYPK